MNVLYIILLALSLSWVLSELFSKLKLPRVLAPIIVGIAIKISPLREIVLGNSLVMSSFSDIGLVFLMFYVGFELNLRDMLKSGKISVMITILNVLSSFTLGFAVGKLFGFSNLVSGILGASISVTAEAMAVNILEEVGMLKSRIGTIVVSAGLVDNIIEILMIAVIVALTEGGSSPLLLVPFLLLFALVILIFYRYIIPKALVIGEKNNLEINMFMLSVILALVFSVLADYLGFGFLIGALIAGFVMSKSMERHGRLEYKEGKKSLFGMSTRKFNELKLKMSEHQITINAIKTTAFGLLVPFFFIWVGLNVELSSFLESPLLVVALTVAAFGGQLIGSTLGSIIGNGSTGEGFIIGWALNSRGSVELVFAEMARSHGIISGEIFSAIVFMTLFTTLLSPVMFKYLVLRKKHHVAS
ncbi:cation:proton antiporter [Candidatus Woesearchaeota archaeon]|nr:cation:proton antiporter [Candidatus Woesearchaeota archaeon]